MLADAAYPALLLNADFQPVATMPLSTLSWRDAVKEVFADRVTVVREYDVAVRSPSIEVALPSVVALKVYVDPNRPAALTRYNVFLRDAFSCLYCGQRFPLRDLTFDHVVPRSRGGRNTFANLASACLACNNRKANRTPAEARMPLLARPYQPTVADLNRIGRRFPPAACHQTWRDCLYWDAELGG